MRKLFGHPLFHLLLFLLTFLTTTLSGSEWTYNVHIFSEERPLTWELFVGGMTYSICFLTILTLHEFGHYLTAKYYGAKVTLPYYIPFWLGAGFPHIGTMGAVIQIKSKINSRKEYFDIAVAGPLAGFIAALIVLIYGFTHLPPPEYIFIANPEYLEYGLDYPKYIYNQPDRSYLLVGDNLLFYLLKNFVATDPKLVPNNFELMHYPFLFSGYLACFFTALNLLPIGQLDGGHILYGLFGSKKHAIISRIIFMLFVTYAGLGVPVNVDINHLNMELFVKPLAINLLYIVFLSWLFKNLFTNPMDAWLWAVLIFSFQFVLTLYFPHIQGYEGWLVFSLLLSKVMGIYHPLTAHEQTLNKLRKIMGWLSIIIFILCFSPQPFKII